jgi:hypothetical protein
MVTFITVDDLFEKILKVDECRQANQSILNIHTGFGATAGGS